MSSELENKNKIKKPPQNASIFGNGPPHARGPVEKPKNFRVTFVKLLKYMKSSLPVFIFAMILGAVTVALTINIPNVIGEAMDFLFLGVMKKEVYQNLSSALAAAGVGMEQVSHLTLSEFLEQFGTMIAASEGGAEAIAYLENLPDNYISEIMNMSLRSAPVIDTDVIMKMLVGIIIMGAIAEVLDYLQSYILAGVSQKVSYRMRQDLYKKVNKLPLKYYDDTPNGEVLSRITNDVDTISTTLNQTMAQIVWVVATIIGVIIMMIRISLAMTGIALTVIPVCLTLIFIIVKLSQKFFVRQQKSLGEINGHIEEMYSAHSVVALYNGQEKSKAKFEEYNESLYKSAKTSQFLSGLLMPMMGFIGNLGFATVCVSGGVFVINGKISIGQIQAFIQYFRRMSMPIGQSATIAGTLQSTMAAAERVFEFLNAADEPESGTETAGEIKGDVEFKDVIFGYDPSKPVINGFSSSVQSGSRVAIVGPTGAGKTTIVKLLMRFYDIGSGQILLDGEDINKYSRAGLRKKFGMVLQDTWLFNGTIMENIRYGNLSASDDDVIKAAKTACVDTFIHALPGGYNFVLSEDAENISQGQKQLLTIARAVLADPKVLILDEATSSVDTRTEQLIQRAMENLMKGRTSFIIAHRLSTIRDADKILVMRSGDIAEQGSHDELMRQKGFYAELYNSQFA